MSHGPDFESYSREELVDIYRRINGIAYPDRKAKVAELLGIKEESTFSEEPKVDDKYSTFWPRFFASIIDGIFLSVTGALLGLLLGFSPDFLSFLKEYVSPFAILGYFIILHGIYGQTLGKLLTSVKVVNHTDEGPITMAQSILRECTPLIVFAIALFVLFLSPVDENGHIPETSQIILSISGLFHFTWILIELLTMLLNEKRRALHDYIAGTVVINT